MSPEVATRDFISQNVLGGAEHRDGSLRRFNGFHVGLLATTVIANAIALYFACQDRSWGALGIAIAVGPSMNAILAAISLALTPVLRRLLAPFSVGWHVVFSLLIPATAIGLDFLFVVNMRLSGC